MAQGGNNTASTPTFTPVTIVHESSSLPKFIGESVPVHEFLRDVRDETVRGSLTTDKEKIALLKSHVDLGDCLARDIIQSDQFSSFTDYEAFKSGFIQQFSGSVKVGALDPL